MPSVKVQPIEREGGSLGLISARYPAELGTAPWEKWILFEVRSGRHIARDGFVGESVATPDRTVASVALYLPTDALKSSMAIGYKDISMGAAAGQAIEGMFQKSQGATAATVGAGGGILDKLKSAGSGVAGVGVGFAQQKGYDLLSAGASAIGADSDTIEALVGGAVNPRTDSVFDAVSYRTHDFDFSLIPRSKTEADSIDVILNILHFYSLPSYGTGGVVGNFFIGYPYEFVITLFTQVTGGGHHINTIERSVLTNLDVDHAGGDRVAFVDDRGQKEYYPAATRMSLSFKETRLLGRDVDREGKGVIYRGTHGKGAGFEDLKAGNAAGNTIVGVAGGAAIVGGALAIVLDNLN